MIHNTIGENNMRYKEIKPQIEENAQEKPNEELVKTRGKIIKNKPRIIEYEDMTDKQKQIVDMALAPADGIIPNNLTDDELQHWILNKIRNA